MRNREIGFSEHKESIKTPENFVRNKNKNTNFQHNKKKRNLIFR